MKRIVKALLSVFFILIIQQSFGQEVTENLTITKSSPTITLDNDTEVDYAKAGMKFKHSILGENDGRRYWLFSELAGSGTEKVTHLMLRDFNAEGDFVNRLLISGTTGNIFWNYNKTGTASYSDFIVSNGNVGIGTASPKSLLDVAGRGSFGRSDGNVYVDWTYQADWGGSFQKWAGYIGFNAYRNDNDEKDYYYGANKYTPKMVFEGSSYGFRWLSWIKNGEDPTGQHLLTERMRLTDDGRLGIGTTDPGAYKLAVKGSIGAGSVKVTDVTGWADFVFSPNYRLRPLEEVEQFIESNGHLPEIPSEEDVKANGVNIGEMEAKLLQKIEELTLYMIEQEKRLKKVEQDNEQLKKVNAELKTELKNIK